MRLKSFLIIFTVIASVLGGFFFQYLFVFLGLIIIVYFLSILFYYYKQNKPVQQAKIVCPRCMISVDYSERKCPNCGEEL